jgi:hypothetical protein
MIKELYEKLKEEVGEPTDENWCVGENEEGLLYILSWGPWHESREEAVFREALEKFRKKGKRLHELNPQKINFYPLKWQNDFLKRIILYLRKNNLAFDEFIKKLKEKENARDELFKICKVKYSKVLSCVIRDIVKANCFPIDRRVRSFLIKHKLPISEDEIIKMCKKEGVNPRIFARMVYLKGG